MDNNLLGKKIKELRKINGYTQEQVANRLGIKRQAYAHYEKGIRTISSSKLAELAILYGVSVDIFLMNSSEMRPLKSNEETTLLRYFNKLSNQNRKELIEIAKLKLRLQKQN